MKKFRLENKGTEAEKPTVVLALSLRGPDVCGSITLEAVDSDGNSQSLLSINPSLQINRHTIFQWGFKGEALPID